MIPLLDRDLLKSFLTAFAGALTLTLVLTFVNVMLDNYRYIFGGGDSRFGFVLLYYILTLPQQASYMLPLAASASILWVLLQKARENEILAYLSCGVSPARIARPFILCAALISVIGLALSEAVAGRANAQAHRIEKVYIKKRKESVVTQRDQIVVRLRGDRYVYVGLYDDKLRRMEQTTIIDLAEGGTVLGQKVEIESGELVGEGDRTGWKLQGVSIRKYDPSGGLTSFEKVESMDGAKLDPPLEGSLSRFLSATQNPQRMTYRELREYLDLQAEQGRTSIPDWETELQTKVSVPFVTLVLGILMCAHAIRPTSAGVMKSFGGGLGWLAVVFAVQMLLRKFGDSGIVPALVAAWFPPGLFGALGLLMLSRPRFA